MDMLPWLTWRSWCSTLNEWVGRPSSIVTSLFISKPSTLGNLTQAKIKFDLKCVHLLQSLAALVGLFSATQSGKIFDSTFIFIPLSSTQRSNTLSDAFFSFFVSCTSCIFHPACVGAAAWLKDCSSSRGPHRWQAAFNDSFCWWWNDVREARWLPHNSSPGHALRGGFGK